MPPNDLSLVRSPVTQARGLPNANYIDAETHQRERRSLLFDGWAGLVAEAEVPEPGDALPVDFDGMPLLVVRGRDGAVRVFQNTCRHRGMILVDAPRKIEGAIRCPYHSWCYSTKGQLVSTPHVGGPGQNLHEAVKRDDLGLFEIRSTLRFGLIWVDVMGNAAPFDDAMAPVLDRWAEFDRPWHHGGDDSRFSLTIQANWKLAVENYCESYHLPWIHPGLNSYSRLEDHYNIELPDHHSGQGSTVYRQLTGADGATFPDFDGLSAQWMTGAEYLAVYPNVLLGVHRDHTFAIILRPSGPERTDEHVHIFYTAPDTDPAMRAANSAQWRAVFEEDVFVVEGMQRGRHGLHFDGGRFSPAMDGPTHNFHAWVAGRLSGAEA